MLPFRGSSCVHSRITSPNDHNMITFLNWNFIFVNTALICQ